MGLVIFLIGLFTRVLFTFQQCLFSFRVFLSWFLTFFLISLLEMIFVTKCHNFIFRVFQLKRYRFIKIVNLGKRGDNLCLFLVKTALICV